MEHGEESEEGAADGDAVPAPSGSVPPESEGESSGAVAPR